MESNIKTKKGFSLKLQKKAVFVVLIFSLLFFPLHQTQAALWPGVDPNIKQMLENIQKRIEGIALSILKQEAMKIIDKQIDKLVGGSSSTKSTMFITNWNSYLVKDPKDRTKVYMNDYLSQITKGRGSNSGYRSEGFSGGGGTGSLMSLLGGGGGGSYASQLVAQAKKETSEKKEPQYNYPGDPKQMFATGTFKNMSLFFSGINNPWAFSINAQEKYQEKLKEEKKIAETRAVAYQGFKGTESKSKGGGLAEFQRLGRQLRGESSSTITTPGSVVKDMVSNVKDIGNKIMATAQHPEEIIVAVVSQMMTKFIQQGMGEVGKMIDQETSKIQGQIGSQIGGAAGSSGTGAFFNSGWSSSTNGNGQGGECQGRPNNTRCGTSGRCQNGTCRNN